MIGYKIFLKSYKNSDWSGPHFACQPNWQIRNGAILTNPGGVDDRDEACSYGINFYPSKSNAIAKAAMYTGPYKVVVYKIKTLRDSNVVCPEFDTPDMKKFRADKIQLLGRIATFRYGRMVKK